MSDTPKTDEIMRMLELEVSTKDAAVWNTFQGKGRAAIERMERALQEIRDECDGKIDIDKEGRPNTEARIDSIAAGVL